MARACGRAVVNPETGSAFDEGQRPLVAFLRPPQPPCSPFVIGVSLFVGGSGVGTVDGELDDVDEEVATDDAEFVRCGLLRGMNIRVTSSALMVSGPSLPSPEFHEPKCWRLGGDATAVIGQAI